MLPKIDAISSLLPEIEAPQLLSSIGTNKQSIIEKIIQFSKGQNLQAEVLAKLPNGQYEIKIADTKLNVKLPNNPQIGEKLNLTILTLTPRIIISIEGAGRIAIDDTNSSQQLLNQFEELVTKNDSNSVKLAPKIQIDTNDNQYISTAIKTSSQSSSLDLSDAGKLINQLLKESASFATNNKANINNNTPLLLTPSAAYQAKSIATILNNISIISDSLNLQLKHQISSSGLFYESHVAAWTQGKFQQQNLFQEPQANIPIELRENILNKTDNILHEKIVQLIHQQLDVGENHKINWQGMLFPNAPMEWIVKEEKSQTTKKNIDTENNTNWNSKIHLSLPTLGDIEVRLQLKNNFLSLNIAAEKTDSVDILKESQNLLNQSILNTGTTIQTFSITHQDVVKNE